MKPEPVRPLHLDIPESRPVLGRDVHALQKHLGLSSADMWWLLGLSPTAWARLISAKPGADGKAPADAPVPDPSLALLVRWLARHPEDCPVPKMPHPSELYDRLRRRTEEQSGEVPLRKRWFGLMLGRDGSAGSRWSKFPEKSRPDAGIPALVARITYLLTRRLDLEGLRAWDEWCGLAQLEAKIRGVKELYEEGSWKKGRDVEAPDPKSGPEKL